LMPGLCKIVYPANSGSKSRAGRSLRPAEARIFDAFLRRLRPERRALPNNLLARARQFPMNRAPMEPAGRSLTQQKPASFDAFLRRLRPETRRFQKKTAPSTPAQSLSLALFGDSRQRHAPSRRRGVFSCSFSCASSLLGRARQFSMNSAPVEPAGRSLAPRRPASFDASLRRLHPERTAFPKKDNTPILQAPSRQILINRAPMESAGRSLAPRRPASFDASLRRLRPEKRTHPKRRQLFSAHYFSRKLRLPEPGEPQPPPAETRFAGPPQAAPRFNGTKGRLYTFYRLPPDFSYL